MLYLFIIFTFFFSLSIFLFYSCCPPIFCTVSVLLFFALVLSFLHQSFSLGFLLFRLFCPFYFLCFFFLPHHTIYSTCSFVSVSILSSFLSFSHTLFSNFCMLFLFLSFFYTFFSKSPHYIKSIIKSLINYYFWGGFQHAKHDEAWMILKHVHDTNWRAKGEPERVFTVSDVLTEARFFYGSVHGLHNFTVKSEQTPEMCFLHRFHRLRRRRHRRTSFLRFRPLQERRCRDGRSARPRLSNW